MEKITRMEKIKEVAETFIYCDIQPTDFGFIVSHPYTDSAYLGYVDGSIIDITKKENYERFIEKYVKSGLNVQKNILIFPYS